ncbi:GIY-YIG nuclease family protein [Shewanella frigidimarina]|uniref:GIY-YIG nuclease family protein n=1 Tax=Shewanella frigidimarina TaxID=56812 RepID=UPI000A9F78A4|nr:GIY-YIG nuclease family protein [Shewanella frigidimarina]
MSQQVSDWKSALSSVSGVYLIIDLASGKLYVGSATGEGGIWKRWNDYSFTVHGGNKQLYLLLREKGIEYSSNFQYSILEIADTHKTKDEILSRESYWKDVLGSKN